MADQQPATPFQQGLLKAYDLAKKLPPDKREELLRMYYQQKVNNAPEFLQMYPTMQERAGFYKEFMGDPKTGKGEEMLYAPETPGAARRIFGEYHNPATTNPWAHVSNAFNALGTPGRAIQEGANAAFYDTGLEKKLGLDRPGQARDLNDRPTIGTATGPGTVMPSSLGGWAEQGFNAKYGIPLGLLLRYPAAGLGAIKRWAQSIEQGQAAAQAENAAWAMGVRPGGPKALPASSSPGTWAMPGSTPAPTGYPPWVKMPRGATPPAPEPTGYAPRPPELMPRARNGGGEPRIINGEAWSE